MSEPRWVGWVWKSKRWHRVCEADALGACSRLLGEKARQLGIRDKHTILTGGGAPTVVPQESHRIVPGASKLTETACRLPCDEPRPQKGMAENG